MQKADSAITSNFFVNFENENKEKGKSMVGFAAPGLAEEGLSLIFAVLINQIFFHMVFKRH